MEELTPIKTIKANFGKPIRLTCPIADIFLGKLSDEIANCEEDPTDIIRADSDIWESSLTLEQRKKVEELTAKKDAAQEAYNPKVHGDNTPEAQAYFKADEELERYVDSTGKHLCYRCSYYLAKQLKGGGWAAACDRKNRCCVRPYTLSCERFTTGITPEILAAEKEIADKCRRDPHFAAFAHKEMKLSGAKRFANQIMTEPSTAFYLYQNMPEYHEKIYEDFPYIMAQTQYPSLPLFLEAYKRWEKDCIIKKGRGKDGMEEVTLSVSQEEFRPKGMVVPPTIAETSNN